MTLVCLPHSVHVRSVAMGPRDTLWGTAGAKQL